jgi:hypothetical protein
MAIDAHGTENAAIGPKLILGEQGVDVEVVDVRTLEVRLPAEPSKKPVECLRSVLRPDTLPPSMFLCEWTEGMERGSLRIGPDCQCPEPTSDDFAFREYEGVMSDGVRVLKSSLPGILSLRLSVDDAERLDDYLRNRSSQTEYALACGIWGMLGPLSIAQSQDSPLVFEFRQKNKDNHQFESLRMALSALNGIRYSYRCVSVEYSER